MESQWNSNESLWITHYSWGTPNTICMQFPIGLCAPLSNLQQSLYGVSMNPYGLYVQSWYDLNRASEGSPWNTFWRSGTPIESQWSPNGIYMEFKWNVHRICKWNPDEISKESSTNLHGITKGTAQKYKVYGWNSNWSPWSLWIISMESPWIPMTHLWHLHQIRIEILCYPPKCPWICASNLYGIPMACYMDFPIMKSLLQFDGSYMESIVNLHGIWNLYHISMVSLLISKESHSVCMECLSNLDALIREFLLDLYKICMESRLNFYGVCMDLYGT